jgi:hypothetical protein
MRPCAASPREAASPFDEIAALNVPLRDPVLPVRQERDRPRPRRAKPVQAEPDGCTAFAVLPGATANGHLLVGQNWDWIPQVQGRFCTPRTRTAPTLGSPRRALSGAKIGLSSAGVAITLNGMTSHRRRLVRDSARPVHVRCYEMLRARHL